MIMSQKRISLQSTGINPGALLSELVKIGEASSEPKPKGSVGKALATLGIGAAGLGLGYAGADLLSRKMRFFQEPTPGRAKAVKIILPILSATGAMLANRYRQSMNREYSTLTGNGDTQKKP